MSNDEIQTMIKFNGFDSAIIGFTHKIGEKPCVAYSYEKFLKLVMADFKLNHWDAVDYMEHNFCNSYMGEQTPVFIHNWEGIDG